MSWTADLEAFRARDILASLAGHGVRFALVGGVAAIAHGYAGATFDVDVVPARDEENLGRLAAALTALGARPYADPRRTDLRTDGSPPEADDLDLAEPTSLRRHLAWFFSTTAGRLDVLFIIDGPGGYEVLLRGGVTRHIGGVDVLVAGLDDLIEAKETAGRPKDLAMLDELRGLRRRPAAGDPPPTR